MLTIGLILFLIINLTYYYVSNYYHRLFSLSLFNILFLTLFLNEGAFPLSIYIFYTFSLYLLMTYFNHHKRIFYLIHFVSSIAFLITQTKIREANIYLSSFFIFQNIWFLTTAYREHTRLNFIEYFTLINFFPLLIAGPLMKLSSIKKSIYQFKKPELKQIEIAVWYFIIGLLFKLYISSFIYEITLTRKLASTELLNTIICNVLFFLRIYCDFNGYSMMAKGMAYVFGIEIPDNFKSPILSHSPGDFWNRWHKTLNQWIKENIYNPILIKMKNTYIPLLLSFIFIALWHQFNLKLIFWAIAWTGWTILFKSLIAPNIKSLKIKQLLVFIFASQIIFFYRNENISLTNLEINSKETIQLCLILLGIFAYDLINEKKNFITFTLERNFYLRYLLLGILWTACSFLSQNPNLDFYYSRF